MTHSLRSATPRRRRALLSTVAPMLTCCLLLALGLGLRPHPVYADLADELDLVIENDVLTEVLSDPDLKADGVHPNAAGYAVIAERLDGLLRKLGGLD